ncbi:MAG TPA: DUF3127 domain-containing protein [Salinimicrobium sp.]|nr:DUF3127 domain-containing protein [Salinimicrobium sp.]
MVVVGQITNIGEVQEISESFKKQDVIVRTVEEYPNHYKIEFANGNVDLLANWEEGANVKISCNVRGKLYTKESGESDVFMSLKAWKIERA